MSKCKKKQDVLRVDCSNAPLDIRPAVNAIVARVEAVSQFLRDQGSAQKIVVVMGEGHTFSIHKILQAAVIRALRQKEDAGNAPWKNLVVAHEGDHALPLNGIKMAIELYASGKIKLLPYAKDIFSQLSVREEMAYYLAYFTSTMAPVAKHARDVLSYRMNIPTIHNDVSRNSSRMFKADRAIVSDVLSQQDQSFVPQNVDEEMIDAVSKIGMTLRNHFMANKLGEFMMTHDSNLAVQTTGLDHIFGHLSEGLSYKTSLTHYLRAQGMAVIPVLVHGDYHRFPQQAFKENPDAVMIEGLSDKSFYYEGKSQHVVELFIRKEEKFIDEIAQASELKLERDYYDTKGEFQKTCRSHIWEA